MVVQRQKFPAIRVVLEKRFPFLMLPFSMTEVALSVYYSYMNVLILLHCPCKAWKHDFFSSGIFYGGEAVPLAFVRTGFFDYEGEVWLFGSFVDVE